MAGGAEVGKRAIAAGGITVGVALVVISITSSSITFDESYFYDYGRRILFQNSFARAAPIDASKLPVSALNALPEWFATRLGVDLTAGRPLLQRWMPAERATYIADHAALYAGRLVTIGFYVALCCLVYIWARELYGSSGGLAATVLTAFLPSVLGHAGLVTVDVAATCTILAAVYGTARCVRQPSLIAALLAGVALGLAQLVKYTAVELFPMALGILAINVGFTERGSRSRALATGAGALIVASAVALVVINAGFLFQQMGVRLRDLPCLSRPCRSLREHLGALPLPFPYEYLNGLDQVIFQDQSGTGGGNVYFLGRLSTEGFWSYYLIASLIKTPLPFFALLGARPWRRSRCGADLTVLMPAAWLFVHLSFFFRTQLGLRYFLPAFPFLAILAAANWDNRRSVSARRAASVLLGLYVAGVVVQCPRYLAYFNVLIGPRINAYRYLADSNVDWGQDAFALWEWERVHAGAGYVLEPYWPATGTVIVRVNDFVGITDPEAYAWLRKKATPVSVIGDSYLVFDVE